jgi:hypothetical protein
VHIFTAAATEAAVNLTALHIFTPHRIVLRGSDCASRQLMKSEKSINLLV